MTHIRLGLYLLHQLPERMRRVIVIIIFFFSADVRDNNDDYNFVVSKIVYYNSDVDRYVDRPAQGYKGEGGGGHWSYGSARIPNKFILECCMPVL